MLARKLSRSGQLDQAHTQETYDNRFGGMDFNGFEPKYLQDEGLVNRRLLANVLFGLMLGTTVFLAGWLLAGYFWVFLLVGGATGITVATRRSLPLLKAMKEYEAHFGRPLDWALKDRHYPTSWGFNSGPKPDWGEKSLHIEEILTLLEKLQTEEDHLCVDSLPKRSSPRIHIVQGQQGYDVELQNSPTDAGPTGVVDREGVRRILENMGNFEKFPERYGVHYEAGHWDPDFS